MHSFKRGDEVWVIEGFNRHVNVGVISSISKWRARVRFSNPKDVREFGRGDLFRSEIHARHDLACRFENLARAEHRLVKILQDRVFKKETVQ
jgi:hypothetical protein